MLYRTFSLSCVFDNTRFADERYPNTAGILQIVFNLFRNIPAQGLHFLVGYLFIVYQYPQLAACLDCIRFFNALEPFCNCFKVFKPSDVIVHRFAASTRPCGGNSIGNLHQYGFHTGRFNIVMVRTDRIDDTRIKAHLPRHLHTDFGVVLVGIRFGTLTDIMQ